MFFDSLWIKSWSLSLRLHHHFGLGSDKFNDYSDDDDVDDNCLPL